MMARTRAPVPLTPLGFDSWYSDARPKIATSLALALADRDLAAEATDEAFVRVLQRWSRVSQLEHPTAYAYKVAFNLARRQLRRRAVAARLAPLVARADANHEDEAVDELWTVISGLSPQRRTAIVLRHVAQLTEPEIAEAMGVTRGTISRTLRAAYDQLRTDIAADQTPVGASDARAKEDRHGRT